MRISQTGRKLIQEFEGLRLDPYLDPAGLLTVGWGHLVRPGEPFRRGRRISIEQAEDLFTRDVARFEIGVFESVKRKLSQNEFDALVSLAFNIGLTNFRRSSVLRFLNRGDRLAAANSFLLWSKARIGGKLVTLTGLKRRRQRERDLFLG